MYNDFFGFREPPFNITPDPRFLYLNNCYQEALAALTYGIQARKGFISLIGEAGTGKTTLLRHVLDSVEPTTKTVLLLNPMVTFDEILEHTLLELGVPTEGGAKLVRLQRLNEFLLEHTAAGGNVTLLIDEAQDVDPGVLEELRLLSNLETAREKIIQIVLAGQPELRKTLADTRLRQLRQRIALHIRLSPLTAPEVTEYVRNRIERAGGDDLEVFTPDALTRLAECSEGVPRMVNVLCDASLLIAFAAGTRRVTGAVVEEAWRDYAGDIEPEPTPAPAPRPAAPGVEPERRSPPPAPLVAAATPAASAPAAVSQPAAVPQPAAVTPPPAVSPTPAPARMVAPAPPPAPARAAVSAAATAAAPTPAPRFEQRAATATAAAPPRWSAGEATAPARSEAVNARPAAALRPAPVAPPRPVEPTTQRRPEPVAPTLVATSARLAAPASSRSEAPSQQASPRSRGLPLVLTVAALLAVALYLGQRGLADLDLTPLVATVGGVVERGWRAVDGPALDPEEAATPTPAAAAVPPPATPATEPPPATPVGYLEAHELVEHFRRAFEARDVEGLMRLFAPDAEENGKRGTAAIAAGYRASLPALSDVHYEFERLVVEQRGTGTEVRGPFVINYRRAADTDHGELRGEAVFELERRHGEPRITRLNYRTDGAQAVSRPAERAAQR